MIAIGRLLATGFDEMSVNMLVQRWHCDESEHVETENGTGYESVPERFPIFTT